MNPQFPHKCVITRETKEEGYRPATVIITLLKSACGYRTEKVSEVSGGQVAEYCISLPKHGVYIKKNDAIEVTDNIRTIKGTVIKSTSGNLGSNIWFNEVK